MDILTFTVGDMRVGLPFAYLALSVPIADITPSINEKGTGVIDTTLEVVDLRIKFGIPMPPGEGGIRLITVEIESRLMGLIINKSSSVSVIRDARVDLASGVSSPYMAGMVMDQNDTVLIFDWKALLNSDAIFDVNNLFKSPVIEDDRSTESQFIEAIVRDFVQTGQSNSENPISKQQIRDYAQRYGIPLSIANRLVTFYLSQSGK